MFWGLNLKILGETVRARCLNMATKKDTRPKKTCLTLFLKRTKEKESQAITKVSYEVFGIGTRDNILSAPSIVFHSISPTLC